MKNLKIKHYAKALVEIGEENSCWSELLSDLKQVSGKFNEELELKQFLLDKHIGITKKKDALEKIFKDFIGKRTYNFILLLIRTSNLAYLDSILLLAEKMQLERGGVREVIVESVSALSPKQEKELTQTLVEKFGKDVVIKNLIKSDLLGGIKVTIGDVIIDSSILGKIERLRTKIQNLSFKE